MMANCIKPPFLIRLYLISLLVPYNILNKAASFYHSLLGGIWLGLLSNATWHRIDEVFYSNSGMYVDDDHNLRGFFDWERFAFEKHFNDVRRLLVTAAGSGRELLALARLGRDADGFECNPHLVRHANALLAQHGYLSTVRIAPRDECPTTGRQYDGAIVGWGSYTNMIGRGTRIQFLRQVRAQLIDDAPLLLSFYTRTEGNLGMRVTAGVGSLIRRVLGREPLELGDNVDYNFVHCFTRDEIDMELRAAGFMMTFYSNKFYGHAVARANPGWMAPEKACRSSAEVGTPESKK